jgi:beta-lactamase regulating signal transducer with metallopeptidase domain
MSAILVLLYAAALIAFVDALRRPASQWVQADRNKTFWLMMLVLLNVLVAPLYALFVVPRFTRGQSDLDAAFLKRSTNANPPSEKASH